MTGCRDLVTITIVSHGHGPLLVRLLNDLNCLPSCEGVATIVTLNSPGELLDPSSFPNLRIRVIRNTLPKGFAANQNQAFEHCATPWFAVLNPDLRITDDVFATLISRAALDRRIALVAPVVQNSQGQLEDSERANLTPWSVIRRLGNKLRSSATVGSNGFRWYAGMFYLIRSDSFAEINGFDDRYFLYCEDYDFCARLYLKGHRLLQEKSASVVHDAQRSSHRSIRYSWFHLKSLLRVWASAPVWKIAFHDLFWRSDPGGVSSRA